MKKVTVIFSILLTFNFFVGTAYAAAWSYAQTFDSLTTADLNGQDSWSGDTTIDVQTASTRKGAKDARMVGSATVARSITSVDSGEVYFSTVSVAGTPGKLAYVDSTGVVTLVAAAASGTWYDLNLVFLSSTTFKIRWKVSGGSWSAFSGTRTYANSESSPATLKFYGETGANPSYGYFALFGATTYGILVGFREGSGTATNIDWDEVGATDPDAGGGAPASIPVLSWFGAFF